MCSFQSFQGDCDEQYLETIAGELVKDPGAALSSAGCSIHTSFEHCSEERGQKVAEAGHTLTLGGLLILFNASVYSLLSLLRP